jgi:hypothetical protein
MSILLIASMRMSKSNKKGVGPSVEPGRPGAPTPLPVREDSCYFSMGTRIELPHSVHEPS